MAKVKVGLALGCGAARGWAHIGVLRGLLQAGIVPDVVAGTSIGAVVGGCHVAGRLEPLEEFALSLTRRRVFGYLDFNMAGSGLITGQRLRDRLGDHIGDASIESLGTLFTAVATEIGTGHEIWLSRGRLVDAIRASYALPGIFKPVNVGGRWLFDGALVNPVPVSVCRAMGARYVIAVNLNADMCGRGTVVPHIAAGYQETPPAEAEAGHSNGRSALKLLQRQLFGRGEAAPGISTVVVDAFNIVQDRIARSRLAGDPPDFLIQPRLAGIGPFDFHRAEDLIARGLAAARREVEDIAREIEVRRLFEPRIEPDPPVSLPARQ
ncbi:MAG: patatin-like phospholipase family protein [Hyphomicrobiaceae bacterium]|nr:patatin-like phospholipase family protein [Hyphomicrobiaceae bacterium]